jgi:hypothetical protein
MSSEESTNATEVAQNCRLLVFGSHTPRLQPLPEEERPAIATAKEPVHAHRKIFTPHVDTYHVHHHPNFPIVGSAEVNKIPVQRLCGQRPKPSGHWGRWW